MGSSNPEISSSSVGSSTRRASGAETWAAGGAQMAGWGVRLDGETEAGTSSGGLAQRVGARLGSSSDSEPQLIPMRAGVFICSQQVSGLAGLSNRQL